MQEKLKIVKRERPDRINGFRLTPSQDDQLKRFAQEHGATVSDIIISALKQTGVIS